MILRRSASRSSASRSAVRSSTIPTALGRADGSGWVRFPWPLVLAMKLVRALPQPLYERMHPLLTRAQGRS